MGKIIRVITSPLSIIDRGLGKIATAVALVAAGIATGNPALISAGISIGSSALKSKSPQNSRENIDRLRANIDPLTPRKTVIGNTAFATDIRDEEFTDDQTYFHRFIVCASHAVESIDEIWFDDKRVWTSSGGVEGEAVGYLTVATRTEGSAANAINISARMGTTRRYTGLAYVHLRYKLTGNSKKTDSPYAQSITTRITIRGKGAALPDPRDVAQDMADQATWAWDNDASRNPALALLFYLLGWRINDKLAVGKGIPPDRIDLDSFITAANICDESVTAIGGGTEPRYRCDGVWSEGDSPTTIIDMLKACMNADLDDVGGKLRLTVFHNDLATPDADFADDDIIDGFTWQPQPPLDASFNVVRGLYTDASDTGLYQQVDYPEQRQDSPDGVDRISTFNLPMVQSAGQAQRLAQMRLQRQNYAGMFEAEFQASAWKVNKNSVIRLTFGQTGFTTKLFRVAEMEIRQDGRVPMKLREENALIYGAPALSAAIAPIASTPFDPTLNPLIQAIDEGNITFSDPAPFTIQASSAGVTTTDLASVSRSITLFVGGAAQTTGVTVGTVTASPSTAITASASVASGIVTVTLSKADSAGSVNVPVVFGGVTYNRTVIVNRVTSTASSGGGAGSTSFTDTTWTNISTDSLVQVTDAGAIVQSDGSGELQFSFSTGYDGSAAVVARAQYSTDGTTWTDAGGGDETGSIPIQTPGEEESGFLSATFTQTGLTPSTDYYVRLRCRRSTGTGTISFLLPNFTVSQP